MKKLTHLIVLSCQKATLLIEKGHAAPLPWLQRLQLQWHLRICDGCLQYQKQSLLLDAAMKRQLQSLVNPSGLRLSDKTKELIQRAIDENSKKE